MPKATLSGDLQILPNTGSDPQGSNGCQYGLSIRPENAAPTKENSSTTGDIDSSASFVTLPVDADMRGRVFYLRTKEESPGPLDIRLTQLGTGATTIARVKGQFFAEVDSAEAITAVEIQGVGKFEWVLFGVKA